MRKRILSVLLLCAMCLNLFPMTSYAKDNKVYDAYQKAVMTTVASGSWTEKLNMTANMTIAQGGSKVKTKATLTSEMDVSNYSSSNPSKIEISGVASMSIMGQKVSWNTTYKDGFAHYEYTEPNHSTGNLEMDPNFLNIESINADMIKNGKIKGNTITFIVPGDKMTEIGIGAVQMMTGVDDLKYGDIDVEVQCNPSTGAIDTILMKFHASMTYQGYDSEVDYEVEYEYENVGGETQTKPEEEELKEFEVQDGIVIYSDYQSLSVQKDGEIIIGAGVVIGGNLMSDTSGITFYIEDATMLELVKLEKANQRCYFTFKAMATGTTNICFSDSKTGFDVKVPITVYENHRLVYSLGSVPEKYYEKDYPTNIYNVNGMYIDNYKYSVENDGTAKVSFDVYNTNYTYAFVEVYREDGTLKTADLIKRNKSRNTSIKEALWDNVGCLIRDISKGTGFSYRQESGFSVKTEIEVEIPKNGYIKITNDPVDSPLVSLVNSGSLFVSLTKLTGKIANYKIDTDVFSEKLTMNLIGSKIFEARMKDGDKFAKELWKNIRKETLFSRVGLSEFCDSMIENFAEADLDKIFLDTLEDVSWDVGEDVFLYFSGQIKIGFDIVFAIGKLENIIIQYGTLKKSEGLGSIYIQNQGGSFRASQQVRVESDTNFSEDTSLSVFQVTLEPEMLDYIKENQPEIYKAVTERLSYTYNISLLKNGTETQPEDKVRVYIPIPEDMKHYAYTGKASIYRVEEDGSLTKMDVKIDNGCFVFETSHFSLYTLVGEEISQMEIVVISGLVLIVILLFFVVSKRKKKAKIRK